MSEYRIEEGLIVTGRKNRLQCAGYIFAFNRDGLQGERSAYDPNGIIRIDGRDATQEEINQHNRALADLCWAEMLKRGKGVLYLHAAEDVGDWTSAHTVKAYRVRKSRHNFAGENGRTDVWFVLDGSVWHGVNIGDNQILRVRRTKQVA